MNTGHRTSSNTHLSVSHCPDRLQNASQHAGQGAPGAQPLGHGLPRVTQVLIWPHVLSRRQAPEQQDSQGVPRLQTAEQSPPSIVQQRPSWHVPFTMARQVFSPKPRCDGLLSRSWHAARFVFLSPQRVNPGRHAQRFLRERPVQIAPGGHFRPLGLQDPPTYGFSFSAAVRVGACPKEPARSPIARRPRSRRRDGVDQNCCIRSSNRSLSVKVPLHHPPCPGFRRLTSGRWRHGALAMRRQPGRATAAAACLSNFLAPG